MATQSSSSHSTPMKHQKYFFGGEYYATFQVKTVLYRLPRYIFKEQSEGFCGGFELPAPVDGDGVTEENPIVLQGVSNVDFERFVEVLMPQPEFKSRSVSRTFEEWASILRLARMWVFPNIESYVLSEVRQMKVTDDPLGCVRLAREFSDSELLKKGYEAYGKRDAPLSFAEAAKLEKMEMAHLMAYREKARGSNAADAIIGFNFSPAEVVQNTPHVKSSRSLSKKKSAKVMETPAPIPSAPTTSL